ncbi:serine hydrolase domain-containing protein [Mesobacillus selenatarsenatis]|uniref:Penicillin-binding protein n=1 Tax=Mesobacillus selenatarsenatis (strain DSM 18680 / JCM 14380 / FERM P-15431 / SF-1) TaxID=1321606 RepID=A0A0A8X582_MESS1|nr:serine hydrolase [Mesobacillus selenatarsenatis]GAM15093.1 penicillin-binding protein [Mesobacillus selenatarsenatis SF-1]
MNNLELAIQELQTKVDFSGAVMLQSGDGHSETASFGYANRTDLLKNNLETRFGIASGCKLFTAIAICQLVEEGKLNFDMRLKDCLDIEFPSFSNEITIHHLLTHTSGITDYFDEDVMDDFEELWIKRPMYHIRRLKDFIPMFQNEKMKFTPGETFHYNNAGYILLGLIVEQVSEMEFTEYVQKKIFEKAGMNDSGYFSFDALPANTALGYIDLPDGSWKTNIYSLPVKGGSDGGAYVTVGDMSKLWKALFGQLLLNEETLHKLLTSHAQVNETGYYGYGVWIKKQDDQIVKFHVMGYDPGVSFHSAYYPASQAIAVVCSNKSSGASAIMEHIEDNL